MCCSEAKQRTRVVNSILLATTYELFVQIDWCNGLVAWKDTQSVNNIAGRLGGDEDLLPRQTGQEICRLHV